MIRFLLLCVLLSISGNAAAQLYNAFHENFELPGLADSMVNSSVPVPGYGFSINTRLHSGTNSLRSDSCQVKPGNTVYLTGIPFSTAGMSTVRLVFDHICKVDFLDNATVEVSANAGATWTQLTYVQYLGSGQFATSGNRFNSATYPQAWLPASPAAVPQASWWRTETFDLSTILDNCPSAMVRFKLQDGGTSGPSGNAGWFLDNVRVEASPWELIPPQIVILPSSPVDLVWNTGPFQVSALITDSSGIDTAFIVYTINNGLPDTAGMSLTGQDTMTGLIPQVNDGDQICWFIVAIDASLAVNIALEPETDCILFTAKEPLSLPYFDYFDAGTVLWTPGFAGTNQNTAWELGTPSYGETNSVKSLPNAWDVNLSTAYAASANCILTSPLFDFSDVEDATLQFWLNFRTEANYDGTRMEYTTDGSNWQILGSVNDTLGSNWYSSTMVINGKPAWNGNSGGWKKSAYKLGFLNHVAGSVRFRYVFTSDQTNHLAGISLDNFSISEPAAMEASLQQILIPPSGCNMLDIEMGINIKNEGQDSILGGLTASYRISPSSPVITENVPGTIAPGETLTYFFAATLDLPVAGQDSTYFLKVWINLAGDPIPWNDTLVKQVISLVMPPQPLVTPAYIAYGAMASLTVSTTATCYWFSAPVGGVQLATGLTYTTPPLYETTVYYIRPIWSNGCVGEIIPDTVFVATPPLFDGAMLQHITPVSGVNLGNSETVRVRIKNYGSQAISNFPLSYQINNLPAVTENFTGILQPGDTAVYTFIAPADLNIPQYYYFKDWISVPGDTVPENDTVVKQVASNIPSICVSAATSTGYEDIGNVSISNLDNGIATPVYNNPASMATYTDNTLNVPPVHLAAGNTYPLSVSIIYQGSFYSTCCKAFVDWNHDGQFDEAAETVFTGGPTTSSNNIISGSVTLPYTALPGYTRFRVVAVEAYTPVNIHACGTYTWGETEDYTALIHPGPVDAGVLSVTHLPDTAEGMMQVHCMVKNYGPGPLFTIPLSYSVGNNPPVSEILSIPGPSGLPANGTVMFQFPVNYMIPQNMYTLQVYTQLPLDIDLTNDTCSMVVYGLDSCQQVIPQLSASNPPLVDSINILICANGSVSFNATALYPENDTYYHQSDSASLFIWDFGDGNIALGQAVSHQFPGQGGYEVFLTVKDCNGCSSQPKLVARVNITTPAIEAFNTGVGFCTGIPVTITAGSAETDHVQFHSSLVYHTLPQLMTFDTSKYIPDGGAASGITIESVLNVSNPGGNMVITDAGQVSMLTVNMEHSASGNLEISIECPNGQSVLLKSASQTDTCFLGLPLGITNHTQFDCISPPSCLSDPLQNPPGQGWTYRFSMNSQYDPMLLYANTGNCIPPPPGGFPLLDSGSYLPSQDFSNLLGCPVNGNWTLKLSDDTPGDNGWVFWWQLVFADSLMPYSWVYEVLTDSVTWVGPGILSSNNHEMIVFQSNPGIYTYTVNLTNTAGCSFDTTFTLEFLEGPVVSCSPDQTFLQAASTIVSCTATGGLPPYNYLWSFGGTGISEPVTTISTTTYYVSVTDSRGCTGIDSVRVTIGGCPYIMGQVLYDNLQLTPLSNVTAVLSSGGLPLADTLTGSQGDYLFADICQPGNYNISVNCTKPHGGVNAVDALTAMKSFVGMISLSPLQEAAGDVDASGSVNAVDALSIMKRFTGMSSQFAIPDWVFEDGEVLMQPGIPAVKNLHALCAGDLDRSHIPGAKTAMPFELTMSPETMIISNDIPIHLPVYTDIKERLHALSLVFEFDSQDIRIWDVIPESLDYEDNVFSDFLYKVDGNQLRIAWYSIRGLENPADQALFRISLTARKADWPPFRIAAGSEAAGFLGNIITPAALLIPELLPDPGELSLNAHPNPAGSELEISFFLPRAGRVQLSLFDALGQETKLTGILEKPGGLASQLISLSRMRPGVYTLRLMFYYPGQPEMKLLKVIKL
ncbi:MAG TPA: GEVED domain-containing protein [Bacteroidales bacterium]|nr:GEVED domain-containing protein [Bacteroidales bacterium]HSA44001.1 GEVED domain-containing protein [Bacteroidales bacterium]